MDKEFDLPEYVADLKYYTREVDRLDRLELTALRFQGYQRYRTRVKSDDFIERSFWYETEQTEQKTDFSYGEIIKNLVRDNYQWVGPYLMLALYVIGSFYSEQNRDLSRNLPSIVQPATVTAKPEFHSVTIPSKTPNLH
jgi:hypothetical protein